MGADDGSEEAARQFLTEFAFLGISRSSFSASCQSQMVVWLACYNGRYSTVDAFPLRPLDFVQQKLLPPPTIVSNLVRSHNWLGILVSSLSSN